MKETRYLIFNAKREARVVTRYAQARIDETVFRITIDFPSPRAIAGEIALTIGENIANVDGVEMIPLSLTVETPQGKTDA
jgi:hypothetical protein